MDESPSRRQPDYSKVQSLAERRASNFLKKLAHAPFVAIVFEDGDAKVFTKGLDEESAQRIHSFVEELRSDAQ